MEKRIMTYLIASQGLRQFFVNEFCLETRLHFTILVHPLPEPRPDVAAEGCESLLRGQQHHCSAGHQFLRYANDKAIQIGLMAFLYNAQRQWQQASQWQRF